MKLSYPLKVHLLELVQFYLFHILTILGWRTLTPRGSYAERGRPMTTGAQEVTTVDELQLRFVGGGGVVG